MAFLAAAAPIIGLIGTAVSAVGTLQSGLYQAKVADNNAKIAQQNATYTRQAGEEAASVQSMKGAAQGAEIKAGQAANGIDVNTGSAVDIQEGARETNKLDVETVLNNSDLAAYGYTTQATNFKAQSAQDTAGAIWGATGSLLENASSTGIKWGNAGSTSVSGDGGWPEARAAVGFGG